MKNYIDYIKESGEVAIMEPIYTNIFSEIFSIIGNMNSSLDKNDVKQIGSGEEVSSEEKSIETGDIDLEIGGYYIYNNSKGNKINVKLISKDKQIKAGEDGEFLTDDDVVGDDIKDGLVFVRFKNKDGKISTMSVDPKQLDKKKDK